MLNIGIIGGGFVGSATRLFETQNTNVKIFDLDPSKCYPQNTTLQDLKNSDIIFICVPTPMNEKTGECYTQIVEKCIHNIRNTLGNIDIVVRSTVPIGFSNKHNCHFMPEFLTEKNWKNDFLSTSEWIIGIDNNSNNTSTKFTTLINNFNLHNNSTSTISFITTSEAEAVKYFRNCFLATKVSFCNEFSSFCNSLNVNYETVRKYASNDSRIGHSHTLVPGPDGKHGYSGTCFPKDMASLEYQMATLNVESTIIKAANDRNNRIDRPDKDWSLDKGRAII